MSRIKREKDKVLEYEDAPSGYVTLYHYKEPFMKFEDGFGFQGALLFDGTSGKIQCHFCGKWFDQLGHHLKKEHNMNAEQYKNNVGLTQKTALINEKIRAKLIASGLDKRLQNLRNRKGIKPTKESIEKMRNTFKKVNRERQNLRGTCPEQLIDRLLILRNKLGRTPTTKEIPFIQTLIKTYGTYQHACFIAGIPYENDPLKALERGRQTSRKRKDDRIDNIKKWILQFYIENKRMPKKKDYSTELEYSFISHNNKSKVYKEVLLEYGLWDKSNTGFRFTKDELIKLLRNFEKNNNRKPSYSDCKRGLLPHLSRFSYHFGSWKNTLSLAFKDNGKN